jgi:DNA-binding XRE family transcriptional regulator
VSIEESAYMTLVSFRKYLKAFFALPGAPTQSEVAERAGITRENLNRIANGRQRPTLDHAEAIALATGTTLARILKDYEQ